MASITKDPSQERWRHSVYWILLTLASFALVRPLWIGAIPGLTDFGGHLAMAEIWVNLDSNELYSQLYTRRGGFIPNLLAIRFTGWLHPLFSTLTGLRLFVTLSLLLNAISLHWLAVVFGRSRWSVFLALPFMWGGMLTLGLINYVAIIPFILLGIAAARRAGETSHWKYALALFAISLFAFVVHGLGFVFVVGLSCFTLVLSLHRVRDILHFLAFAPSVTLWAYWMKGGAESGPANAEGIDPLAQRTVFWEPIETLTWYLREALNVTMDSVDSWFFCLLLGLLLLFFATAEGPPTAREERQNLVRRIYGSLREHAFVWTVVVVAMGVMLLPAYIGDVTINTRLMTPLLFFVALMPRPLVNTGFATVLKAAAVLVCFAFAIYLGRAQQHFDDTELVPLTSLLSEIPEGKRVECLGLHEARPVFIRLPLNHGCAGLVHYLTGGDAGGGFANTPHNAVAYREGQSHTTLSGIRWQTSGATRRWDYLVVRGPHRPPNRDIAELVRTTEPVDDGESWTLYRVSGARATPPVYPAVYEESVGGPGGMPTTWGCAEGQVIVGFNGGVTRSTGTVGGLSPTCRDLERRDEQLVTTGRRVRGPTFGYHDVHGRSATRCPEDELAVGLAGRAALFVDSVGVLCASSDAASDVDIDEGDLLGGDGGRRFEMLCPQGSVLQGLNVREAGAVDAIGVRCVETELVLAD